MNELEFLLEEIKIELQKPGVKLSSEVSILKTFEIIIEKAIEEKNKHDLENK